MRACKDRKVVGTYFSYLLLSVDSSSPATASTLNNPDVPRVVRTPSPSCVAVAVGNKDAKAPSFLIMEEPLDDCPWGRRYNSVDRFPPLLCRCIVSPISAMAMNIAIIKP
ncbi:hypothetical protein COP1_021530 [Malus domestica]